MTPLLWILRSRRGSTIGFGCRFNQWYPNTINQLGSRMISSSSYNLWNTVTATNTTSSSISTTTTSSSGNRQWKWNNTVQRHAMATKSTTSTTNNDDLDDGDDEEGWIPPNHQHNISNSHDSYEQYLREIAKNTDGTKKTTTFIDLDDLSSFSKSYNNDHNDNDDVLFVEDDDDDDYDDLGEIISKEEILFDSSIIHNDDDLEDYSMEELQLLKEMENDEKMKQQMDPNNSIDNNKPFEKKISTKNDSKQQPDWLEARRRLLLGENDDEIGITKKNGTSNKKKGGGMLEVKPYTLLTAEEIIQCLEELGGKDVILITPKDTSQLGYHGLIVATGVTLPHIRVMAETLVRQLRLRKLHESNHPHGLVVGAKHGVEGGQHEGISSASRRRQSMIGGTSKKLQKQDTWMCVDCQNYSVHIQDTVTRNAINLQGLWEGTEGDQLRNLDYEDEDAIDTYVANNPIPDDYFQSTLLLNNANTVQDNRHFNHLYHIHKNPRGKQRGDNKNPKFKKW